MVLNKFLLIAYFSWVIVYPEVPPRKAEFEGLKNQKIDFQIDGPMDRSFFDSYSIYSGTELGWTYFLSIREKKLIDILILKNQDNSLDVVSANAPFICRYNKSPAFGILKKDNAKEHGNFSLHEAWTVDEKSAEFIKIESPKLDKVECRFFRVCDEPFPYPKMN